MTKLTDLKRGVLRNNHRHHHEMMDAVHEASASLFMIMTDTIDQMLYADPDEVAEAQRKNTFSELVDAKSPIAANVKRSGLHIALNLQKLSLCDNQEMQGVIINTPAYLRVMVEQTLHSVTIHYPEYEFSVLDHSTRLIVCVDDHEKPSTLPVRHPWHWLMKLFSR